MGLPCSSGGPVWGTSRRMWDGPNSTYLTTKGDHLDDGGGSASKMLWQWALAGKRIAVPGM
jgi:hypothetical protein